MATELHERVADFLGWSLRDVRSFSLPTLRELVRGTDKPGRDEILAGMDHVTRSGSYNRWRTPQTQTSKVTCA